MKLIFSLVVLFMILSFIMQTHAESIENRIYSLNFHYEDGNLNLTSFNFSYGFAPDRKFQPETGYRVDILSFEEKIIYSFKFDVPNRLVQLNPLPGEPAGEPFIILEKVDFVLVVPYFTDAKEINVYDPNGKPLFSVDVRRYAQTDAPKTEASERFSIPSFPIEILAGMVIIILAALFFLFRKKSSPQTEPANL